LMCLWATHCDTQVEVLMCQRAVDVSIGAAVDVSMRNTLQHTATHKCKF